MQTCERCTNITDITDRSATCSQVYRPGGGGCSPELGKTIIFQAIAKYFGQKPATKDEK